MTHAAHRMGQADSLMCDYHLLATVSRKKEDMKAGEGLRKFFHIVRQAGAVNMGISREGSIFHKTPEELERTVNHRSMIHATFDSEEKLCRAIKELKKADLGLSITAQGLFDGVDRCCQENGLLFHTIAFSIGVLGPKELIPEPKVLELSTMCGHGFVTFNLAKKALGDISSGRGNIDEIVKTLARPCLCGLFNPERARKILLSNREAK